MSTSLNSLDSSKQEEHRLSGHNLTYGLREHSASASDGKYDACATAYAAQSLPSQLGFSSHEAQVSSVCHRAGKWRDAHFSSPQDMRGMIFSRLRAVSGVRAAQVT
jgi:hypothetical protein